jgi:hypothetical protein
MTSLLRIGIRVGILFALVTLGCGDATGLSRETPPADATPPGPPAPSPSAPLASASATIGPAGGTLTLAGSQGVLTLEIVPDSFEGFTRLTVTETRQPPPAGLEVYSPIYTVEPDILIGRQAMVHVPLGPDADRVPDDAWMFVSNPCSTWSRGFAFRQGQVELGMLPRLGTFFVGRDPTGSLTSWCP